MSTRIEQLEIFVRRDKTAVAQAVQLLSERRKCLAATRRELAREKKLCLKKPPKC
jgi:hypothetical protein